MNLQRHLLPHHPFATPSEWRKLIKRPLPPPTTLLQHPLRGGSQFSESIFWVKEVNLGVDMFEACLSQHIKPIVQFQVGCLLSTLFMLIFEESEPALWLGTAGAGLFMSSVFPTSIALAEYYIDLTGQTVTTSLAQFCDIKSIYSLVIRVVIHRSHFLKRNDSLIIVFNANPSSFFSQLP